MLPLLLQGLIFSLLPVPEPAPLIPNEYTSQAVWLSCLPLFGEIRMMLKFVSRKFLLYSQILSINRCFLLHLQYKPNHTHIINIHTQLYLNLAVGKLRLTLLPVFFISFFKNREIRNIMVYYKPQSFHQKPRNLRKVFGVTLNLCKCRKI